MADLKNLPLKDALLRLEMVKANLATAEEKKKALQKEHDFLATVIVPQAMEDAGILDDDGHGSCTTPSGMKVYIQNELYANVTKENFDAVVTQMRAENDDISVLYIHPSTLKAWVKGRMETGKPIPEGVSVSTGRKAVLKKN